MDTDTDLLDRWTLTAEFDPPGTGFEPSALGDAADFYGFVLREWGEESEEDIQWEGDTVILHASNLQYLAEIVSYVMWKTVPRSMTLTRNE